MEEILSLASKVAAQAEVFTVTTEETPVQFEANRIKHIQSKQSRYVALRIIKDGRVGYSVTTNLKDRQSLVDAAVETAAFGMKAEFELPPLLTYPKVEVYDPATTEVTSQEMLKLGHELIEKVTSHTPDIQCDAEVLKASTTTRIINSRGGELNYRQSGFSLSLQGQLISENDMLFVGESQSSCRPITRTKAVTDVVLRQLELAREQAEAPTKALPVIFSPHGVASALIPPLMAALNGKIVLEGASPLANRRGEEVFDKQLNLADDPTIDYRPQSCPADDEGIPSQRTPLIEAGVVNDFIYDLQTAALAGTESTGNGGRQGGRLPSPTPSVFIIAPGKVTFNDMVSQLKEGLIIDYLMGATQGNILSGDFSGNVLLGYKIENGKIKGRVKDTMVSGNIYHILKNITAIGADSRWVGGAVNTPSLSCPDLAVASK